MAFSILAIDDDPALLEIYRELLAEEGYTVHTQVMPPVDMAEVERVKPDLVVLDWLFGNEPLGMQTLHHLKLWPATAHVPIILCSAARAELREVEPSLRDQGVKIMYKPFIFVALLDAVRAALGQDSAGQTRAVGAD